MVKTKPCFDVQSSCDTIDLCLIGGEEPAGHVGFLPALSGCEDLHERELVLHSIWATTRDGDDPRQTDLPSGVRSDWLRSLQRARARAEDRPTSSGDAQLKTAL